MSQASRRSTALKHNIPLRVLIVPHKNPLRVLRVVLHRKSFMTLPNMDLQHLRKPLILGPDVMKKYNESEKQRLKKQVAGMN